MSDSLAAEIAHSNETLGMGEKGKFHPVRSWIPLLVQTFKEWSDDPGPRAAFEKMYGAGSWENFMKEWMDILVDYNAEIRSQIN